MVSKIKPQQNKNINEKNKQQQEEKKQKNKLNNNDEITIYKNNTLGAFSVFEDSFILNEILSELSCEELINCQLVSPGFYILCNDDRLWKDAFFRQIKGRKDHVKYIENWKITAISFLYPNKIKYNSPYYPLSFPKFSSHEIYTRWLRRHMKIKDFGVDMGYVNHIECSKLTVEEFIRDYEIPSIPVIFKGAQDGMECMKGEWSTERLCERYGDVIFKIAHQDNKRIQMTFRDYCQYMKTQNDEEPLYVFDQAFGEKAPELLDQYRVPKYFPEDLFECSGTERPHFRWIVVGPERSGASWHIDPAGTSAWNSLVSGKKRWLLYPPQFTPFTVETDDFEEKIYGSPPSLLWLLEVYPYLPPDYRPIECIQEPGETIFVPGGWWHMVLNLEESIAVTQNFCDSQNFNQVCQDLANNTTEHTMKDYEQFKEHLLLQKPEFKIKFDQFEFKNNQLKNSFDDDKHWNPVLLKLLKFHKLLEENQDESILQVELPSSGLSPVFIVNEQWVIKFYCSEISGGLKSWENEIYLYSKIKENQSLYSIFPKLISSGKINEVIQPTSSDDWNWPYIITEYLKDKLNIQDVQEVPEPLPYPYNFPNEEDDDDDEEDDEEEEEIEINEEKLKKFINKSIYDLHSIPIDINSSNSIQSIQSYSTDRWLPWKEYIKQLESKYIYNLWNWNGLPIHLRSQLSNYLPTNDLNQLIDYNLEPCFIHGDLTDENLLGIEKSKLILNKQLSSPSNNIKNSKNIQYNNNNKNNKNNKLSSKKINTWEPTHLIDLGDSQIGDRWYELVSLHISLFAGNKDRLRSFLSNYKLNFVDGTTKSWLDYYNENPQSFIKRVMSYTLIHHCDAITTITRHFPEYRNALTIEEFSKLIWELK